MKKILVLIALVTSSYSYAGTAMKFEGSCTGKTSSGPISFNYHSNFNGCRTKNTAAISFTSQSLFDKDLYTGVRKLAENDVYTFEVSTSGRSQEILRLKFENSTGNTSGRLRYLGEDGTYKNIKVRCEIRDYEYGDC